MGLSSFVALLLFASFFEAQNNREDLINPSFALQPTITCINAQTLQILFPNSQRDKTYLCPADMIDNQRVPCLNEGVLEGDRSSSVAVSGYHTDDVVDVVIYTKHLAGHKHIQYLKWNNKRS